MPSTPDRGAVTDWLLAHLREKGFLPGDIEAPEGAGWGADSASPDAEFTPYTVVIPGTSSRATGSLGDAAIDWRLPYTLTTYGVNRRQVEDLADDIRRDLGTVQRQRISLEMKDGTRWRITVLECTAIGGVGHTNVVIPTAFSMTDSYVLTISRSI